MIQPTAICFCFGESKKISGYEYFEYFDLPNGDRLHHWGNGTWGLSGGYPNCKSLTKEQALKMLKEVNNASI